MSEQPPEVPDTLAEVPHMSVSMSSWMTPAPGVLHLRSWMSPAPGVLHLHSWMTPALGIMHLHGNPLSPGRTI